MSNYIHTYAGYHERNITLEKIGSSFKKKKKHYWSWNPSIKCKRVAKVNHKIGIFFHMSEKFGKYKICSPNITQELLDS